ncbi:MAG TPA: hypothetical protein VF552_08325 [Allosphingosinicella sp.]|jgi:hypothetical protein
MTQWNSVNPSSPRELRADEIAHVSGGDGGYLGSGNRGGMLGSGTRSEDETGLLGSGGGRSDGGGTIGSGT